MATEIKELTGTVCAGVLYVTNLWQVGAAKSSPERKISKAVNFTYLVGNENVDPTVLYGDAEISDNGIREALNRECNERDFLRAPIPILSKQLRPTSMRLVDGVVRIAY